MADDTRERATAAEVEALRAGCDTSNAVACSFDGAGCQPVPAPCNYAKAILTALRHMDAARAAAGMVVVAREPTEAMVEAGRLAVDENVTWNDDAPDTLSTDCAADAWSAMIRATLPAQEAGE